MASQKHVQNDKSTHTTQDSHLWLGVPELAAWRRWILHLMGNNTEQWTEDTEAQLP